MGWFSDIVSTVSDFVGGATDVLGDITETSADVVTGDVSGAVNEFTEIFQQTAQLPIIEDVFQEYDIGAFLGEAGTALGTAIGGPAGGAIGGLLGQRLEQSFALDQPRPQQLSSARTMPAIYRGVAPMAYYDDVDGGEVIPTGGALGGAMATAGIWLGTLLARTMGRGLASAVFTAANGVRVRLRDLWPLVRQYGPQTVAGALGITVGALGTLLAQSPTTGRRKRRRGISARDVATTRRTIRQLRKLTRMAGIRTGGGGRYRPRARRSWHYGYH